MKRRRFLKNTVVSATGTIVIPTIIPSSVFGKNPPSDKINIGQIGLGRIATTMDLSAVMRRDIARVIACCDLDTNRLKAGKDMIDQYYAKKTGKNDYINAKMFDNYREMLSEKDIDAVVISTPDHWHAQPAIEAALAGKDVFCQKPTTLTIAEEMPVPKNLNYDMWLGSTPEVFYTEMGVHPQTGYGRPGWMKRHQFGAGGITNTGQHYIDVAAWGMNTEYTGPVSVEAVGRFPRSGIFDVPSDFLVKAVYENDLTLYMSSLYSGAIKYEGTEGWITTQPFEASDPKILTSEIKENEIHLLQTDSMHGNWLECIKKRKPTLVPAEVAHRSCSVALLSDIAMIVSRKLNWDPAKERFKNDAEATGMLSRTQRKPYGTNYIKR